MPDLVLATPDGVPRQLLDLWDRRLFTTFRADLREDDSTSPASRIRALHQEILRDHQKTWFQLCRNGYRLLNNDQYKKASDKIVSSLTNTPGCAIVDPLLCFFAPLWEGPNNDSIRILFFSEPMECATGLRDKWRFPIQVGLALWEYYVINALRHLQHGKYMLFSLSRFRDAPARYLNDASKHYHLLKGAAPGSDADVPPGDDWIGAPLMPDPLQFATGAQDRIFSALETNSLDELDGIALSDQSSNLLFHYGNLRAGYDEIKNARDDMERKLNALQETKGSDEDHSGDGNGTPPVAAGPAVEVVVHLEGMKPLRFVSEPDSPVIEMLTTALQNQSRNPGELVYLESQGTELGALYFVAGDLLAVETNRAVP